MFIGGMGIMEGRSRKQIKEKYKDMYSDAIIANWKVWPLAQLINFRFMPLPYRVPFSQVCGVFWTLYLSMLNSRSVPLWHHHDGDLCSRLVLERMINKIVKRS
jgi:protein Mpv17